MENLTVESVISTFGGEGPDAIRKTAYQFGIKPQAIYGWIRRNRIPRDVALVCHFSSRHPYTLDFERYSLAPSLLEDAN